MNVKLLLFGEALNIPKTDLGLGVNFISVWIDGEGFTSAGNSMGALGYILLETPAVDIGDLDAERAAAFGNLHGRSVTFDINPNTFFKDGGIADISMTVAANKDGQVVRRGIEFRAENCRGVVLVDKALHFTVDMLQLPRKVAVDDSEPVIADDLLELAVNDAPQDGGSGDDRNAPA